MILLVGELLPISLDTMILLDLWAEIFRLDVYTPSSDTRCNSNRTVHSAFGRNDPMDSAPRKPSKARRFFRSYLGRAVIGLALIGVIQFIVILIIVLPYRREQRIAAKIEALGGRVKWIYSGPDWVPLSFRGTLRVFDRISGVNLEIEGGELANLVLEIKSLTRLGGLGLQIFHVTDAELEDLKGLKHLVRLTLVGSQVSDFGLEHLKGLTGLGWLDLGGTIITDRGLGHLTELKSLGYLFLTKTNISDTGLEHLRHLTNLTEIDLSGTHVTDIGLQQLIERETINLDVGVTLLNSLNLNTTQTTERGRAMLRKSLPNCDIQPNP